MKYWSNRKGYSKDIEKPALVEPGERLFQRVRKGTAKKEI